MSVSLNCSSLQYDIDLISVQCLSVDIKWIFHDAFFCVFIDMVFMNKAKLFSCFMYVTFSAEFALEYTVTVGSSAELIFLLLFQNITNVLLTDSSINHSQREHRMLWKLSTEHL